MGRAESEDCHSVSAALQQNANPLPSITRFARLSRCRGLLAVKVHWTFTYRSRGLETFVFLLRHILRTPRFCLRTKSLRSLCKISSSKSQKTPACYATRSPQGRMIAREQGVPRPKASAFRPRHNIIIYSALLQVSLGNHNFTHINRDLA